MYKRQALPRPLLKGGRSDLLMQKFTPGAGAIGFAVYLDELDRLSAPLPPVQKKAPTEYAYPSITDSMEELPLAS